MTRKFLKDLFERMLGTAAATFVALVGVQATLGDVNWKFVASATTLASILTAAKSVAAKFRGDPDSGSFIDTPSFRD